MQERRSSERVQLNSVCTISLDGFEYSARLVDISDSGVSFMISNSSPFIEAKKEGLKFTFQQTNGVSGTCKIVRLDKFSGIDETLIGCKLYNRVY